MISKPHPPCRGRMVLAFLAFALPCSAQLPPDAKVLHSAHRGLSYAIQLQGAVERTITVESSSNGSTWTPEGNATEFLPGLYQYVDTSTAGTDGQLYKYTDTGPVVPGAWADFYAVTPTNGGLSGPSPYFEWQPYPGPPPIDYTLNVYEFEVGPGGRLILPSGPILSVGGLVDTHYHWSASDPDLNPTHLYAYNVSANVFGTTDYGTTNFFVAFGGDGHTQSTDWGKLMEVVKSMLAELGTLETELGDNQLISEINLIKKLVEILSNYELFKDYITAALDNRFNELIASVQTIDGLKKILCFLEDASEVILQGSLSSAQRNGLTDFKNAVSTLKARLDDISDISVAWDEFQELINDLRSLFNDPVKFFLDAAKDAFVDKLKSILIHKFGEAAAGALISIVINVAHFADALITINSIENLITALNDLLLTGIENSKSSDVFNPNGTFVFPLQPGQEGCSITIAYKKICFKPSTEDGAGPTDGTWEGPTTVKFADGSSSKTKLGGAYSTTFAFGINKPYKYCDKPKDPADVDCKDGPCIVFVEITIVCDGKPPRKYRIFAGVIKKC